MTITFINEFEIAEKTKRELADLLQVCFPDAAYNGNTFFKQLPHYRLLLKDKNKTIGQVAIDYRIMKQNNETVKVFGVVDLAVHPDYRNKGLGTLLMQEYEKLAVKHTHNIDFIFLVTDKPEFYKKLGYKITKLKTTWLKINNGKNYGLGNETVDDCFLMYKPTGSKIWKDGTLDMLGYWY